MLMASFQAMAGIQHIAYPAISADTGGQNTAVIHQSKTLFEKA
jgi:hypothetical protein